MLYLSIGHANTLLVQQNTTGVLKKIAIMDTWIKEIQANCDLIRRTDKIRMP